MVMKKRQLCGLLVLLCIFLTACSAAAETEPVSISFMHGWGGNGADHVGMRELFAEFEAENPDIHIVYDTSPDLGIVMEKAADMLAVDKTPNIISTNGNVQYVSNATKKGVALDLTPYLQEDATFASDVSPQILQALQEPDGAVYTLPDAVEYIGYWYNASLFQQAGITDTGTPEGTVVLLRCAGGDLAADRRRAASASGQPDGILPWCETGSCIRGCAVLYAKADACVPPGGCRACGVRAYACAGL